MPSAKLTNATSLLGRNMTELSHSNSASQAVLISKAVVAALSALSAALTVAAVVIAALACVVWVRSGLYRTGPHGAELRCGHGTHGT